MEIVDTRGQGMVMKFCKIYSGDKILKIVTKAKEYSWWKSNPIAAFMKAVGEVNKLEKATKPETDS
jgi:hypothetical protein